MKKRSIQWMAAVLAMILLCMSLWACGATNDQAESQPAEENNTLYNQSGTIAGGSLSSEPGSADGGSDTGAYSTKIIRTADLRAETKTFDAATSWLLARVAELDGYVESSSVQGRQEQSKNQYRTATYQLRIPAGRLDEFLSGVGESLNVIYLQTADKDISQTYYDAQSRLAVLQTEKELLSDMLAKAESLQDMILLEQRLYEVIEEIESRQTQLQVYDKQVAYSTVTLALYEVADLTVVAEDPGFGARFAQAAQAGWQDFAEGCKELAIDVVYALPGILLFLVFAGGGAAVILVIVKKHRKKKHLNDEDREGSQ